jgi:hypothetical protein
MEVDVRVVIEVRLDAANPRPLLRLKPHVGAPLEATMMPQVRSWPGLYRSVLSGMANSASQPRSVMPVRTIQSASQSRLNPPRFPWPACPSAMTWPSYSIPNGLVPNTNAFRPSLNVSSRRLAVVGFLLDESAERLGVRPGRIVNAAVDQWSLDLAKLMHGDLRDGGN